MEAECLEQCNCCKSRVKVRVVKSGVDGPRNTPVRKGWVAEKSLQKKTRLAISAFLLLVMFLATNDSIYFYRYLADGGLVVLPGAQVLRIIFVQLKRKMGVESPIS